jgi:preprotein translocase subunit SecG
VFTFLLFLLILNAIILVPVVLLQSGKGGGLAAMGGGAGTDTMFGGRQAATLLTKLTWWLGGAFIVLAFALQVITARGPAERGGLLEEQLRQTPVAPPAAEGPQVLPGPLPAAPAPEAP